MISAGAEGTRYEPESRSCTFALITLFLTTLEGFPAWA